MKEYTIYRRDGDAAESLDYIVHAKNDVAFEKLLFPLMDGDYTGVYRIEAEGGGGFTSAVWRPVAQVR